VVPGPGVEVDPDEWIALAEASAGDSRGPLRESDSEAVIELKTRLERVLTDDRAMMAPPSSIGMDDEAWATLRPEQRSMLSRLQLGVLDPRLLSRSILTAAGRRFTRSP
jgi:hypothetical protein